MKIECLLDYSTILANQGRPVHLSVRLEAGTADAQQQRQSMAFCVVLDRSGSMEGEPLCKAKAACETVIRNLRSTDAFALVSFDDQANVVLPLQRVADKASALALVRGIQSGGATNLTGGWMLGRDQLLEPASGSATRRLLLLSDGQLNRGIVAPDQVANIVADGLERGRVRTSSLGFGDGYDENLLERLATASGGNFYDANSAEKLPAIFSAELEGLQNTAAQNVRVRVRQLDFCDAWTSLASYREVALPDTRREIAIGDLVSEESATAVLELRVLPIPLMGDGNPAASLEGEPLVELEVLWDDLSGPEVRSCRHLQTIRVLATQNAGDVRLNVDVIPGVATQLAGTAVEQALRAMEQGGAERALEILRGAMQRLKALGHDDKVADGLASLQSMASQIETEGSLSRRSSKHFRYSSSHMRRMKSHMTWTSDERAPDYCQNTLPPPPPPPPQTDPGANPGDPGQSGEPGEKA